MQYVTHCSLSLILPICPLDLTADKSAILSTIQGKAPWRSGSAPGS
ncbi:hypothetical protein SUNI508_12467 [Seiridium unicorne]|uniref:Uncharacterized protein n=1 Tax=Seiridium unicorne TaxID=138068 RepID=A0ABR2VHB8_9PEZI